MNTTSITATPSDLYWHIAALQRPVTDLTRAIDFYVHGLGFKLHSPPEAGQVILKLGSERIVLFSSASTLSSTSIAKGPDVRFQHAAIVASDMEKAYRRLMEQSPYVITRGAPQALSGNANGITAFKFRDPDGHPLELINFAPGVGNNRWHNARSEHLTLGIDHFAISVSDVERSIAFYKRILGFHVASRQVNDGPNQARLDGLDSPVVEVVALTSVTTNTPHLELLGYKQPPASESENISEKDAIDCLVFSNTPTNSHQNYREKNVCNDPDGHAFIGGMVVKEE